MMSQKVKFAKQTPQNISAKTGEILTVSNHEMMDNKHNENKETIHSGHFMVSEFEADDQDDEDDVAIPIPEDDEKSQSIVLTQVTAQTKLIEVTPKLSMGGSHHLSIETSLSKLFQCMSLAYRQKLTSPKWNRFKGIRLRWKDKIRLNNVIWRCWHMQFINKQKTLVCQFASPLDVDTHSKPEAVVLEGKYWKRRLNAVTAEYKKWRMYYRNKLLGRKDSHEILLELGNFDWQSNFNDSKDMMVDEDYMAFMSDTLFSTITANQPYAFPDTREITRGANLSDFIQPSLVQLQPNLDDFMDTLEPLQELLQTRLGPVSENNPVMDNQPVYGPVYQDQPTYQTNTSSGWFMQPVPYTPPSTPDLSAMRLLPSSNTVISPQSSFMPPPPPPLPSPPVPLQQPISSVRSSNPSVENVTQRKNDNFSSSKVRSKARTQSAVTIIKKSDSHKSPLNRRPASLQENSCSLTTSTLLTQLLTNNSTPPFSTLKTNDQFGFKVRPPRTNYNVQPSTYRSYEQTSNNNFQIKTNLNNEQYNISVNAGKHKYNNSNNNNPNVDSVLTNLSSQSLFVTTSSSNSPTSSDQVSLSPSIGNSPVTSPSPSKNVQKIPDHRRACHINAEQKRRSNIKNGFETLHSLLPHVGQNANSKMSKAALLQKGADYIKQLRKERNHLEQEIDVLRQQVECLNTDINNCQSMLPATGAPICKHKTSKMFELFREYVRMRTHENWKFWILSLICEPLLKTFTTNVSTANLEDLYNSTLQWVDQHCSLGDLRPVVLTALRQLCTSTDVLADPGKLPLEANTIVDSVT